MAVFLTVGPTVSFGLGIPLNEVSRYIVGLALGVGRLNPDASGDFFWTNLLISPVAMIVGLPFYGFWAETHLLHVAGWITCVVVLIATSRRGLRVRDAAAIAAGAVLAFPFLVDPDSPLLTWSYPDAVFMALSAAGGAAVCATIVRGIGANGLRRRIALKWLA